MTGAYLTGNIGTEKELSMDRNVAVTFSDQLRESRESAIRDSEAFDGIIHVVERLGSFLAEKIGDLGQYKKKISIRANHSALVYLKHQDEHTLLGIVTPFDLL